jgi:hypothetical protein
MKLLIEEIIVKYLDEANAYKVFILSHRYKSENIKFAAFEEIKKKLPESLIEKPDKVRELIEAKQKLDLILETLE